MQSLRNKLMFSLVMLIDIGLLLYWILSAIKIIPDEYMFKDHDNPIINSWNWSFLPLDVVLSVSGIVASILYKRKNPLWLPLILISLSLMFSAGLMALSFWTIRSDYDITWWIANGVLVIVPIIYIPMLICSNYKYAQQADAPERFAPGDP